MQHPPASLQAKTLPWCLYAMAFLALACGETASTPPSAPPENGPTGSWPQWRGPQRDGTAPSQNLLDAWPEGQPTELWRQPLGEGLGGVAIDDGTVWALAAENQEEFLIALDARLGTPLWKTPLGPTFLDGHGNGPRTTPLVMDGRVFVHGSQQLAAVDAATGKIHWKLPLAEPPEWGYSSSPVWAGDRVVVHTHVAGEHADAAVVALAPEDGSVLWSAESGHPGYASPLYAELAGQPQIVSFIGPGLVGLDPADGSRLWFRDWQTSYNVNAADPVLLPPDRIYVSSGYQNGAVMLQVADDDAGALRLEEVWNSRSMKNHFSSSVRHGDHLFGFDNATFKAISVHDGQTLWRQRGFGKGSLIVADEKLVVLTDDGVLVLVRPSPDGYEELGRTQVLQGDSWTPPSLAGQWLYLRDHQDLVCLNLAA